MAELPSLDEFQSGIAGIQRQERRRLLSPEEAATEDAAMAEKTRFDAENAAMQSRAASSSERAQARADAGLPLEQKALNPSPSTIPGTGANGRLSSNPGAGDPATAFMRDVVAPVTIGGQKAQDSAKLAASFAPAPVDRSTIRAFSKPNQSGHGSHTLYTNIDPSETQGSGSAATAPMARGLKEIPYGEGIDRTQAEDARMNPGQQRAESAAEQAIARAAMGPPTEQQDRQSRTQANLEGTNLEGPATKSFGKVPGSLWEAPGAGAQGLRAGPVGSRGTVSTAPESEEAGMLREQEKRGIALKGIEQEQKFTQLEQQIAAARQFIQNPDAAAMRQALAKNPNYAAVVAFTKNLDRKTAAMMQNWQAELGDPNGQYKNVPPEKKMAILQERKAAFEKQEIERARAMMPTGVTPGQAQLGIMGNEPTPSE